MKTSSLAKRSSRKTPSRRAVATLKASCLLSNFRAIRARSESKRLLPMLKANAYGHGAVWAAKLLQNEKGLEGFGVATLEEGIELRKIARVKTRILVFSGALVWDQATESLCRRHRLTPVIATEESLLAFLRRKSYRTLEFEIEWNTGMNRLGVSLDLIPVVQKAIQDKAVRKSLRGMATHFAESEQKESALTRLQLKTFAHLQSIFTSELPKTLFHVSNSSAIWTGLERELPVGCAFARPGLSLYGVSPWAGAEAADLKPVMELKAQVIARMSLKAGDRIGYGGRYTVPTSGGAAAEVATLGYGYADGFLRNLHQADGKKTGAQVFAQGRLRPIAGMVSMDLSAILDAGDLKVGDWVEWLGSHLDPWRQASAAGTVPYELLTSVSARVERKYV